MRKLHTVNTPLVWRFLPYGMEGFKRAGGKIEKRKKSEGLEVSLEDKGILCKFWETSKEDRRNKENEEIKIRTEQKSINRNYRQCSHSHRNEKKNQEKKTKTKRKRKYALQSMSPLSLIEWTDKAQIHVY